MDVATLLKPVSESDPAGPDLEYDPAMQALEEAAAGKPEQVMGDKTIPAEPPNWKEVQAQAEALLQKSKHLRVGVLWCRARLHLAGHAGMREGLQLVKGLLDTYWETAWPRLDPTDNNDPTMRMNIVAELKDHARVLGRIREATLANSKQLGRITFRDVQLARGEVPVAAGAKPPDPAMIEGVFNESTIEDLQATERALGDSIATLKGIDDALMARVGAGKAPDLGDLSKLLKEVQKPVTGAIQRRGGASAGGSEAPSGAGQAAPGGGTAPASGGGGGGAAQALGGQVSSPQDVLLAFEKVLRYYERAEVSSPVPVLVKCAQRLVGKSFPEIAKIMTPDVVKVVDALSGAGPEKK